MQAAKQILTILMACASAFPLAANRCDAAPVSPQIIPLDLTGPHPTAQLTVDGHAPFAVIFDSGAGANLFATAVAKDLGLPNEGEIQVGSPGASAPLVGFRTTLRHARLGDAEIKNAFAVVVDIPGAMGSISGAISPNAFSGRLVRFEFAASRALVLDKAPGAVPSGPAYRYAGEGGHALPAVEIEVAGKKILAHADSGSGHGLGFPLELAKQLPLLGPLEPRPDIHMMGGDHKAYAARISGKVRVGPLELTDPEVGFAEGVPIANVGIEVLKRLTLVLDPETQRDWVLLPEAKD